MNVQLELHPALTRLRRRLELCRAPLVRLWSWPQSGRRLLLQNLSYFHPERWQPLDGVGSLAEALERAPSTVPHLWWPHVLTRDDTIEDQLRSACGRLAAEQKLYLLSERWPSRRGFPEEWVPPRAWRLNGGEVAAMLEDPFAVVSVADWMEHTAGWWGPLRWLQNQAKVTEPAQLEGDSGLADWLQEHVLATMTPLHLEILDACRLTQCCDPGLWRWVWIEQPDLLQGLEEMIQKHAWLGDAWPALWQRTPWTLDRHRDDIGPRQEDERRRLLHRQLGLAAAMHGEDEPARHHLRLGDQPHLTQHVITPSAVERGVRLDRERPKDQATAVDGATTPQPIFDVTLLGLPSVIDQRDSQAPREVHWTLRRALMTLAYLLLTPQLRASREELIAAVWEGIGERSIEKNFHPTLSTLRRALSAGQEGKGSRGPSLLRYRQGVYSLSGDATWRVDVHRLRNLMRQGEALYRAHDVASMEAAAELWQQGWRLYRGPLLADSEDTWVSERRDEVHGVYRRLLRRLAEVLMDLQHHDRALDVYRTLLLEEPFEEPVHLAVMEVYGQQGRRDLVRRQFVRLQELLSSELGVEPRTETQQRFHQLMH